MDRNPAPFTQPPVSAFLVSSGDDACKPVALSGLAAAPVVRDTRLATWSQQPGLRYLHTAGMAWQTPSRPCRAWQAPCLRQTSRMWHPASAPQPQGRCLLSALRSL